MVSAHKVSYAYPGPSGTEMPSVVATPESVSFCNLPYQVIDDPRPQTSILGGRWYRISGDAGTRLASAAPARGLAYAVQVPQDRCTNVDVDRHGWLTDLTLGGAVNLYCVHDGDTGSVIRPGSLPSVVNGLVNKTVCFDTVIYGNPSSTACRRRGGHYPCPSQITVGVINCGGFYLWRLPSATHGFCFE
eukprot:SAG25_NODE_2592_length_1510_cov_1.105599_3_plen_189_part_00